MTAPALPGAPAAPPHPIRIPMTAVLLVALALVAVELVVALLTTSDLHLTLVGVCATLVLVFGLVFSLGAITIAGFAAGAGAAGLVVLEPGHLLVTLLVLAVVALVCGVAPGWARVEAWQAARSTGAPLEPVAGQASPGRGLPSRLRVLWRTDRVVAAFLVLAFPPVFVTGALAFITWTQQR